MDNKEFAAKLEQRTKKFAMMIIRISSKLPNTTEAKVIRYQIIKSGTSIGANYREANRARSKAEFRSKSKICEGEASETQFWLELIIENNWLPKAEIEPIYKECSELLALFTSINKRT